MNQSRNECDALVRTEEGQASGRHALLLAFLAPLIALLLAFIALRVHASTPLSIAGYADFAYGNDLTDEPTANMAESKVWWNDGYWWAILYNLDGEEYRIYRLDADSQEWMDTGVAVDEREDSRADVLWDEQADKLYVASHAKRENPSPPHGNSIYWARLYRYSYDAATDTYSLDSDFPVTELNRYRTESLVLDKDSTGRLWTTWVGRTTTDTYEVYLNYTVSPGNDLIWSDPFRIPLGSEATVITDDISTLVAFADAEGPKIGVAWSNQSDGDDRFHFAIHDDSSDPESDWVLDSAFSAAVTAPADDHLDFATTATGELFLAFKTGIDPSNPDDDDEMLIGLAAREADGTTSVIPVAPGSSRDTRPIVVVNESTDEVYVFTVNKTGGEAICRFPATIISPLSDMVFLTDNCSPPEGEAEDSPAALANLVDAELFIADSETYLLTNNPSSTKQRVTDMTGVLVIASDESNNTYLHNLVGYTPPEPEETATPTGTEPAPTGTPSTPIPTATGTVDPSPTGTLEPTLTPTTEPAPDDALIYLPYFSGP